MYRNSSLFILSTIVLWCLGSGLAATSSIDRLSDVDPLTSDNELFAFNETTDVQQFEEKYGKEAAKHIREWRKILHEARDKDDREKLIAVNNFFNRKFTFMEDITHWKKEDYWATPLEFMGTGGGDCEDFSIAKYFSLRELGVPDAKLRMTYVKALDYNQAHMVVTYFKEPGAVPLVLDNINPAIEPATQRKDLLPIYSFNGAGLWLAKEQGLGTRAGSASRISLWKDLNNKMTAGL